VSLVLYFIIGVIFGSFLNVVILRIPKDESVVFVSSHCFSCNAPLKPWHNVPLLSWFFLRGKCAFCGEKISIEYPLIEFLSGVIFVLVFAKLGFYYPAFLVSFAFLSLLALSVIDIKYQMVPDSLNLLAIVFAIFASFEFDGILLNFQNALLAAGGFTLLRFSLSYILTAKERNLALKNRPSWSKKYHTYPFVEVMGEGDIMVAATMGALLGIKLMLVAVFLSALLALPVLLYLQTKSTNSPRVAFVPFLALATFLVYVLDSEAYRFLEALYS
jgi:leader peptidase (prepilin peptidase)/N-methyltransferase